MAYKNNLSKYTHQIASQFPARALAISLLVVIFIVTFRPFAVNLETYWHAYIYAGLSLVIFCVLLFNNYVILPLIKKMAQIDHNSQRVRYFSRGLFLFSMIAIISYYTSFFNQSNEGLTEATSIVVKVALISIIPFAVLAFLRQNKALKQQVFELQEQPTHIKDREPNADDGLIYLCSKNGKDQLQLTKRHILYIRAEGNYVSVVHQTNHKTKEVLLRATISDMEELLASKGIIRCHRSFLVNLTNIHRLHTHAGLEAIEISNGKIKLPASKTYLPSVREKLERSTQ